MKRHVIYNWKRRSWVEGEYGYPYIEWCYISGNWWYFWVPGR